MTKIKSIVFDIGNVLLRYDPAYIVAKSFPEHSAPDSLIEGIFSHKTWFDLSLGLITETQAINEYHGRLGLEICHLQQLMATIKESLMPMPGSIELIKRLQENYHLYCLTNNTHEIMAYLREHYDFWELFKGIIVSAEIGFLKPSSDIYNHLLRTYQLIPHETVFLDDLLENIDEARKTGMHGIHFKDCDHAIMALHSLGIIF